MRVRVRAGEGGKGARGGLRVSLRHVHGEQRQHTNNWPYRSQGKGNSRLPGIIDRLMQRVIKNENTSPKTTIPINSVPRVVAHCVAEPVAGV